MKLNKLALVLGLGMAVVAGSAAAADQGSGQIKFSGKIIDAPCSILPESINMEVPLGSIAISALKDGGKSVPQPINIKLAQCDTTVMKSVQTTFAGAPSTAVTGGLAINSVDAKNAGIVISDVNGNQIKLGDKSPAQVLVPNTNTLSFLAYLQGDADGTNNPPIAGEFTATATFSLSYQ